MLKHLFAVGLAMTLGLVASSRALASEVKFRFLEASEAAVFLATPDSFSQNLSPLDISLRQGQPQTISVQDHLQFLGQQAIGWTNDEAAAVNTSLVPLAQVLKSLNPKVKLPAEVVLIQTTGNDEFRAAYTRRNAIILPRGDDPRVIAHEFFHVLSRYNPELHDSLNEIAGFKPLGQRLKLDVSQNLITNPDAIEMNHYVEVQYQNRIVKVVPIIYSGITQDQITRVMNINEFLKFKLLEVNESPGLSYINVEDTDYMERTGLNSGYVIHPEEVMADNFTLLVKGKIKGPLSNVAHPEVLEKLNLLLF